MVSYPGNAGNELVSIFLGFLVIIKLTRQLAGLRKGGEK